MKTKVVVLLSGALIALLLLSRYFALSRARMPLGWMLYLGLPIIAAGPAVCASAHQPRRGLGHQDPPRATHHRSTTAPAAFTLAARCPRFRAPRGASGPACQWRHL
jgi:hypothetical protein